MKKFIKITLITVLSLLLIATIFVLFTFPPIMTGMAAKTACSCVMVSGRSLESVRQKELTVFPGLSKATIEINEQDSSVTASLLFTKATAIYRKGLGCTLLAQQSKEQVASQQINRPTFAQVNQDTVAWPLGNLLTDSSLLTGIDQEKVKQAIAKAFIEDNPGAPKNTLAVVVLHKGQLIAEQYAAEITPQSKLMGWSMTKSITNALIGLLVKDGKLTTQQIAPIDEWRNDDRAAITINNLLQATSGLDWSETYFNPFEDFHQMFIKSDDKGGFSVSQHLVFPPNTQFQYSSASTNILALIMRRQLGDKAYYRFPYERLFHKIGMHNTLMEIDASGTFVGSSYCYATARDWARFGLLYYQNGVWNGERILPEGWVDYTRTPSAVAPLGEYGAQWWLNAGAKEDSSKRKYPSLPTDAYWADGFEDQYVMIIPSKDLVIVRLGVSHHGFEMEAMVNEIIDALPK